MVVVYCQLLNLKKQFLIANRDIMISSNKNVMMCITLVVLCCQLLNLMEQLLIMNLPSELGNNL
jgi:hypothetical protein